MVYNGSQLLHVLQSTNISSVSECILVANISWQTNQNSLISVFACMRETTKNMGRCVDISFGSKTDY